MKGFIAVLLLTSFSWGAFTCYAGDDCGRPKTELTKKYNELVTAEVSQLIVIEAPVCVLVTHVTGEVNVKAISRPKEAVANAPPQNTLYPPDKGG
jgi:hypothetical protein